MKKKGRGGGAITMGDIARHAGVSPMTVSRALREPGTVSDKMRRKVDAAVRQFGYLPNRIAGSLSSRRSNIVGLVVPSIRNSLYASMIQSVSDVLRANGLHLIIADSGHSLAEEEALVAALLAQRVCGLVLHNTVHSKRGCDLVRVAGVPVVETGNLVARPLDMAVSYSNFDAAKAMTVHLGRLGYRKIGFVTLPLRDNDRSKERRRGYLAALKELGLPVDHDLVLEAVGGLNEGADALVRLMQTGSDIDAVFFAGDVLALGALFECQRRGWNVPGRIAIASFDDLDLLRHTVPTVTTLRVPRAEIGRRSAELLVNRLRGAPPERVRIDVGFEIVQRDST
ncbi:transcriptional regulator, LacI family [Enhydrobacter aerosaccus]|uniref:Transcriptional regulator, LacI family n=1 Tax=Enhydrobacter aerosaccus TaxID=225324 RepID=A0A1T4LNR8_9HYPH|nr:LacI family DNA-binding transcriptional regulator [Enhydrobacter aerosaccus]SJZ56382.1 transcriptional regulator, LacI family [Enhydrobacter aerosaccus]